MSTPYQKIIEHIFMLDIIDTHEHLPHAEEARNKDTDVLREYLTHYFNCYLISAGLPRKDLETIIDVSLPIMDRWKLVAPWWDKCRHTGYGQALDLAARGIYGIPRIDGKHLEALNAAFLTALRKGGRYRRVLRELSRIKVSLLDYWLDCDQEFFRSVYRLDVFIAPRSVEELAMMEKEAGKRVTSFGDWLTACEAVLDRALERGAVALKCGLAYSRSLKFELASQTDAGKECTELLKHRDDAAWWRTRGKACRKFEDAMMHHVLRLANQRGLTYQFHTGLQEGNGNIISNSDPSLMSNLFLEYPDVRFDLFHIGYPYQQVVSTLAKNFPNVFIDMCWAHIISSTASVNALSEYIDTVPVNKISAFGGDYAILDGVYGHQQIARENVAKALTLKVEEGVFDVDRACEIAEMLFVKNPIEIFKLKGKI